MEMIKVQSSNIQEIGWEKDTLYVKYASGTYAYYGVKQSLFEALKNAESKGRFMNDNIKSMYKYSKII